MAELGSRLETSTKDGRDCSYWKECRRATARLRAASVDLAQEGEKWMEPSSSAESLWSWRSSAQARAANRKNSEDKANIRRIKPPKMSYPTRESSLEELRRVVAALGRRVNREPA